MSMYIIVETKVVCDKCGEKAVTVEADSVSTRDARKQAKTEGWKLGKQKDFCPTCAKQIKEAIKAAASGL